MKPNYTLTDEEKEHILWCIYNDKPYYIPGYGVVNEYQTLKQIENGK